MSLAIRNDRVFTEDSVIESGAVVVENRNISYYALPTSVSPDLTVASIPGHTLPPRHIVAHICTFDLSCENYSGMENYASSNVSMPSKCISKSV